MHILMTADTIGGVWTYALDLVRELAPFQVHVSLATMGARLRRDQIDALRKLTNVQVFESDFKLCWMESPWQDVERAGEWLRGLESDLAPDLIHLNDFGNSGLPWQTPVLLVAHSCVFTWFAAVHQRLPDASWNRYRHEVMQGLHRADLLVAPTAAMLRAMRLIYGPVSHSLVIPNGRDTSLYYAQDKQPIVLSAGRLWDEAKNTRALAQAAAQILWPVYIAGEAAHPDGSQAQFQDVHHLGSLTPEQMAKWFRATPIYALPARYEPFGLSALEAALSGAALVLGDIESLREVWGSAALYVSPDDPEALAEKVNRLIADTALRNHYARRARERAAVLSPSKMARRYHQAYLSLRRKAALREQTDSRPDIAIDRQEGTRTPDYSIASAQPFTS